MVKRFSTSTLNADGTISPWLAASGPLAYTPENPPDSNYFFQYGWLMPKIFPDRRHYYFGYWSSLTRRDDYSSSKIDFLIDFWSKANARQVTRVLVVHGETVDQGIRAPIAVYQYQRATKRSDSYMLIQHGSYQTLAVREQPLLQKGIVTIHRGIGNAPVFNHFRPKKDDISEQEKTSLSRYWAAHQESFADSERSFSIAHAGISRSETDFLSTDESWSSLAAEVEFEWTRCELARLLRSSYLQSFTLDKQIAERKFGPNYVVCQTPVDNIRLTTFFAGEHEVLVLDPSKLEIVKTKGCKSQEISRAPQS